jgi:hypothetical protein
MGAAVIAIMARKERDLVEVFTRAGATSPVSAKSLSDLQVDDEGAAMRRLRSRAVIRETGGRYYVDLESWEALHRMRRRMGLTLLVIVLVAFALFSLGVFKSTP